MRNTILKRDHVRVLPPLAPAQERRPGARSVSAAGGEEEPCEKRVRPLERDGIVHAVEVTCSCGSVTVVELTYLDGGSHSASTEAH